MRQSDVTTELDLTHESLPTCSQDSSNNVVNLTQAYNCRSSDSF